MLVALLEILLLLFRTPVSLVALLISLSLSATIMLLFPEFPTELVLVFCLLVWASIGIVYIETKKSGKR